MSVKQALNDFKSVLISHMPIRILNVSSTISMGVAGLTTNSQVLAWTFAGSSVVMLILAAWGTGCNDDEAQQLKDEVNTREQEIKELKGSVESLKTVINDSQNGNCKATKMALDRMLNTFAKRILINVGAKTNSHIRVTLYGCKPSIGGRRVFVPLARSSHNPQLERMGRKSYPDDEGFIRQVWENDAGTWKSVSKTEKGRKTEFVNKFKMPMNTVDKLTMIPCSMAGIRLDDTDGKKLGLLILESDDEKNMNYLIDHLDELNKEQGMLMCVSEAIGSLGPYLEVLAK